MAAAPETPLVALRGVHRVYPRGATSVVALAGVDLEILSGEKVAIMGPSGSGKTTLLSILGCLDRPTSGSHFFAGRPVEALDDDALSHLRNREIGFVFQSFHLIPQLTVAENVETPCTTPASRRPSGGPARSRHSSAGRTRNGPTTGPTSSPAAKPSAPRSPAPW